MSGWFENSIILLDHLVVHPVVIVLLCPTHPQPTHSAGIIIRLEIRPNVAANPALGRQTTRPATSGDPGRRPTPPIGRLFYVRDKSSNTQFLVDTGTEVSVVPPPAPSIHINRIPSRYSQSMDPLLQRSEVDPSH